VRVVGGAVRDSLLGVELGDIDLATIHGSDEIMARAKAVGIKAVPTGGEHGTVSLIMDNAQETHVYEVTPLRIDVATDGRHARVAPTQNWSMDAHRRDFTLNALYCNEGGKIYDFVGGYEDVLIQHVRFIGVATTRIEEDYLRILRFFRFSARYAQGSLDEQGLAACIAQKEGLLQLSAERIKQELFKLLVAPFAGVVLSRMVESGIMNKVLSQPICLRSFIHLVEIERALNVSSSALLRLASLAGGDVATLKLWAKHLKLSNKESAHLVDFSRHVSSFTPDLSEATQKALLYELGHEIFKNCALLAWSLAQEDTNVSGWERLIDLPQKWQPPVFPLSGADVLALGIAAGPRIGEILSRLEQGWIEAGFKWDAAELAARLKKAI